eukprot:7738513-Prorocentrum_lima.AAC.1
MCIRDSSNAIPATLQLLRYCHLTGEWDQAGKSWLVALLQCGLVVKRKTGDQWMLSLGPTQGVAAVLWPLEE